MPGKEKKKKARPARHQEKQPGVEHEMIPVPVSEDSRYVGSNKLLNKIAVISGGDSGIGKAVAIAFAKQGADVAILYKNEHKDAEDTRGRIINYNRKCLLINGGIGDEDFCKIMVSVRL